MSQQKREVSHPRIK